MVMNDSEKSSLVEQKKEINETVSRTVDKIFDAKDAWNGKAAPDIGVTEPHSITEPIPQESVDAFQDAVDKMNAVNSKLKQISEEQSGQSNRTKEKKESPKEVPLDLSAIASSAPSRFMAHLKAPMQFGDKDKWARLKLLRAASTMKSHLEELDEHILSTSESSIPKAVYKAKDLFYIFENELFNPVANALRQLPIMEKVEEEPEKKERKEENKEPEPEAIPSFEQLQPQEQPEDYQDKPYEYVEIEFSLRAMRYKLQELSTRLPPDVFNKYKPMHNDLVREIRYVSSLLKNDYNSAEQAYRALKSKMDTFNSYINAESQDFQNIQKDANKFTRFLKQKKLKYLTPSSSHQKPLRLRADTKVKGLISQVNRLMNALEKRGVSPSSLSKYVQDLAEQFVTLYDTISDLAQIHNSEAKLVKHKSKDDRKIDDDDEPVVNIPNTDITTLAKIKKELSAMSSNIETMREQRV